MKKFLTIIFIFFCGLANAQSLIPAGDFENTSIDSLKIIPKMTWNGWKRMGPVFQFSPTNKDPRMRVPMNILGFQPPHSGVSYIGVITENPEGNNTILVTKLKTPMKKGAIYRVNLFLSACDSNPANNRVAAFFSDSLLKKIPEFMTIPSRCLDFEMMLPDAFNWVDVHGQDYVATGTEQYLYLGSFFKNKGKKLKAYYMDDVTVAPLLSDKPASQVASAGKGYPVAPARPVTAPAKPAAPKAAPKPKVEEISPVEQTKRDLAAMEEKNPSQPFLLKNLNFTPKNTIVEKSYPTLDSLVSYLKKYESLNVTVAAHTDNSGSEEDNLILSIKRARAVADYLTSNGIGAERVRVKGYGPLKPIADNKTEAGRNKNKRIEVIFSNFDPAKHTSGINF